MILVLAHYIPKVTIVAIVPDAFIFGAVLSLVVFLLIPIIRTILFPLQLLTMGFFGSFLVFVSFILVVGILPQIAVSGLANLAIGSVSTLVLASLIEMD